MPRELGVWEVSCSPHRLANSFISIVGPELGSSLARQPQQQMLLPACSCSSTRTHTLYVYMEKHPLSWQWDTVIQACGPSRSWSWWLNQHHYYRLSELLLLHIWMLSSIFKMHVTPSSSSLYLHLKLPCVHEHMVFALTPVSPLTLLTLFHLFCKDCCFSGFNGNVNQLYTT